MGTRGDRARPGTHSDEFMARILIPNGTLCNRFTEGLGDFPSQTSERGCSNFESEILELPGGLSCQELFGTAYLSEWP